MSSQIFSRKPGRAHRLQHLADVTGTAPTDGQALVYNSVLGQWEPADVAADTAAIEADILELQDDVDAIILDISDIEGDIITLDSDIDTVASSVSTLSGTVSTLSGNLSSHVGNTSNPHSVTFSQVADIQRVTLSGGDFSLGTTSADVTGMSLVLPTAGTYLVFVDARCVYNQTSTGVETYVSVAGTEGPAHVWESAVSDTVVISFVRVVVTSTTNVTIQLRALEKVSSNTSFDNGNTHMVAMKAI